QLTMRRRMSDPDQAQPTGRLWGDMFGIGPLMRLINDPELGAKAQLAVQGVIAGTAAMARIEAKLDFLLRALGHHPTNIGRNAVAALPARLPNGGRRDAVASPAPDHGSRGDPALPDQARPAAGTANDRGGH